MLLRGRIGSSTGFSSLARWHMPAIAVLRRLRQDCRDFQTSLGFIVNSMLQSLNYIVRLNLKYNSTTNKKGFEFF